MIQGYDTEDLIAALSTPWGESALAVIRTSGKGALERISGIFKGSRKPSELDGYSMVYGKLMDGDNPVDEVVLGVYRAPKSYTGEDMAEIFCHGSLPGIRAVLELLRKNGFRSAQPGEFTLRSFLNGKMDLTRAEAVHEIITAGSRQAQALALSRLSGTVFNAVDRAKHLLADIMAALSIQLDYAEDEADPSAEFDEEKLDEAYGILSTLLSTYSVGKLYREGIRIALAGKTNAGKSALFNLFLKEDRSIVSDYRGTTRDYIEAPAEVCGIPAVLIDTAGLRISDDPVEAEGIRRSGMIIENSDIILYLVDSTAGADEEDLDFIRNHDCIPVWNKTDLSGLEPPEGFFPVSAFTAAGFGILEKEITRRASRGQSLNTGEAVINSQRQKELLERALEALGQVRLGRAAGMPVDAIAVDLGEAVSALGEITGEITTADILENMFSHFCVGK